MLHRTVYNEGHVTVLHGPITVITGGSQSAQAWASYSGPDIDCQYIKMMLMSRIIS